LDNNLAGIKTMGHLPEVVIVTDTRKEHIAVKEANKLGVPVIAIVDTNCDPDPIDYPIPANDDAIRAIKLICSVLATAVIEGRASALEGADDAEPPLEETSEPEASESESATDADDVENQESEDSQEKSQGDSQEEDQEDSQAEDQEDNS
jgi:small subunit ribosomal protein S2